jgi:hypothetical protein
MTSFDPSECSGGLSAAIFAHGHSEGQPQEIRDLYMRRLGTYNVLEEIIEHLEAVAGQQEADRATAIGKDESIDTSQRKGMMAAIGVTQMLLRSQAKWGLPPNKRPANEPDERALMETARVTRVQAYATVLNKQFQAWRADLAGHLGPYSSGQDR